MIKRKHLLATVAAPILAIGPACVPAIPFSAIGLPGVGGAVAAILWVGTIFWMGVWWGQRASTDRSAPIRRERSVDTLPSRPARVEPVLDLPPPPQPAPAPKQPTIVARSEPGAVSALTNLGYKKADAEAAVTQALANGATGEPNTIRAALKLMSKKVA